MGTALASGEEKTLLILANGFELILKFRDFFLLVLIRRVFQEGRGSFQGHVTFIAKGYQFLGVTRVMAIEDNGAIGKFLGEENGKSRALQFGGTAGKGLASFRPVTGNHIGKRVIDAFAQRIRRRALLHIRFDPTTFFDAR